MSLEFETQWVLSLMLVATRFVGILLFTPVLGFSSMPGQIRVMLVMALAAMAVASMPAGADLPQIRTVAELVLSMLAELSLGAALGFGILCAFGAFMVGGRVLDYQMGFGIVTLFDPATRAQSSLMGTLLTMLGAVVFLAVDAHHTMIRGVVFSLQAAPIGSFGLPRGDPLVAQFGLMFVYGFLLVSPAVLGLMLVDVAIAVAARLMPQVNIYFVTLPLKVFVGLVLAALSMRFMEPVLLAMFDGIFEYWQRILARG